MLHQSNGIKYTYSSLIYLYYLIVDARLTIFFFELAFFKKGI